MAGGGRGGSCAEGACARRVTRPPPAEPNIVTVTGAATGVNVGSEAPESRPGVQGLEEASIRLAKPRPTGEVSGVSAIVTGAGLSPSTVVGAMGGALRAVSTDVAGLAAVLIACAPLQEPPAAWAADSAAVRGRFDDGPGGNCLLPLPLSPAACLPTSMPPPASPGDSAFCPAVPPRSSRLRLRRPLARVGGCRRARSGPSPASISAAPGPMAMRAAAAELSFGGRPRRFVATTSAAASPAGPEPPCDDGGGGEGVGVSRLEARLVTTPAAATLACTAAAFESGVRVTSGVMHRT